MLKNRTTKDEGNARMTPDIIRAAEAGDINAGRQALNANSSCIMETNTHEMNALQVAMVNLHTDFGLFLLNESGISAMWKDSLERDSLTIASICANNELGDAVWDRWNEEYQVKLQLEDTGVTPINPSP